jgi:uncharacterized protein YhaN
VSDSGCDIVKDALAMACRLEKERDSLRKELQLERDRLADAHRVMADGALEELAKVAELTAQVEGLTAERDHYRRALGALRKVRAKK